MKKAIVLGATGGTGQVIVSELLERGIDVIAFGRSQAKLEKLLETHCHNPRLSYKLGDIFDDESIVEAAKDTEVMFQCANVKYQDMKAHLHLLGESVMRAANTLAMKVVFVDGIYVYGHQVAKGDENHPKHSHTEKGKIRINFEKLIFNSKWNKAKPLIVRLPDYYGPTSQNSYLQPTLEGIAANKPSIFIGNLKTPREYIYLPDAAKMIVNIAERDDSYGENWNVPGAGVVSGKYIIQTARQITGKRKMIIPLNKTMIRFIGLFDSFMREVVEIMYITKEGFVLDGAKYKKRIGPVVLTPIETGLKETLRTLEEQK